MKFSEIISTLKNQTSSFELAGDLSADVVCCAVTNDSRQVVADSCYFAIPGTKNDGVGFIPQAVANGARLVCVPISSLEKVVVLGQPCAVLGVSDVRQAYATCAHAFYENPSHKLVTLAVTGTNGKTSVAWILSEALAVLEGSAGYIGTLGIRGVGRSNDKRAETTFSEQTSTTTPDALALARTLADFSEKNIHAAVIEVSSHALDQHRAGAIAWDGAVITNITRDHLDYHTTFEIYAAAKKLLFTRDLMASNKQTFAVLNSDDPTIASWEQDLRKLGKFAVSSFASSKADAVLEKLQLDATRSVLQIRLAGELLEVSTGLIGRYNALNTIAAALTLHKLGYTAAQIQTALAVVAPVPGRIQPVGNKEKAVFVDYAHTPDALDSVLRSLREIHDGTITTIFGCGGDRDRGKRPMMAKVAESLSDTVIVTSDNPRSEVPEAIVADVVAGFANPDRHRSIVDRREAIEAAIATQGKNELLLIAGKGHEDYQEIAGVKYPFLDESVAREALGRL